MPRLTHRFPVPRLHKASGQMRLRLEGRDFYLGKPGQESQEAYQRLLGEWLANGRKLPAPAEGKPPEPPAPPAGGILVAELVARYFRHCLEYYRRPDGSSTSEPRNIELALRPVKRMYGSTPASSFGPAELKAVRARMIKGDVVRTEINKRVRRIVRMFKWAAGEGLLPSSIFMDLKCVEGLKRGRSEAREPRKVRPVELDQVEAVRPFVARQVWAMIELGRITGMRVGEVATMRTAELDRTGDVWAYTPAAHKMSYRDQERTIYLGPRAQAVLWPWLRPDDPERYLFSPRDAMEEKAAVRRAGRKSPMTPSQRKRRRKGKPIRTPGECYTNTSLAGAIGRACKRAGIARWHFHQLRHLVATRVDREFSTLHAKATLGHRSPRTTEQFYVEQDQSRALEVARLVG